MRHLPSPERALEELRVLFPAVIAGLDSAVVDARGYFSDRGIDPGSESWLFSDIVRHTVRRYLKDQHYLDAEAEFHDLANGGLQIAHNGKVVRLRKAYRGGLRVPGSRREETFYAQTLGLVPEPDAVNLFLLWDVTRGTYELLPQLHLACPRETAMTHPNLAECHWFVQVPEAMLYAPVPAVPLPAEEIDDLDITSPADDEAAAR